MWLIVNEFGGYKIPAAIVIAILLIVWVGSFHIDGFHQWIGQQIPGMILWTDILNLLAYMHGMPVAHWWAQGWTIAMLPYVGSMWITVPIWLAFVIINDKSFFGLGMTGW